MLFVQHRRKQGEWLRQNPRYARAWLHHSPCSLGCRTNNTLEVRSLSLIKPVKMADEMDITHGHAKIIPQAVKYL